MDRIGLSVSELAGSVRPGLRIATPLPLRLLLASGRRLLGLERGILDWVKVFAEKMMVHTRRPRMAGGSASSDFARMMMKYSKMWKLWMLKMMMTMWC